MRSNCVSLYDWCIENDRNDILDRWSFSLNNITPNEVSRASHQKVWWHCSKHNLDYENEVQRITLMNYHCPKCAQEKRNEAITQNSLQKNGSIADIDWLMKWWDYDKNTVDPHNIPRYSREEIWVKCPCCGNSSIRKAINVRKADVCTVCRGNKYYFLGKDGTYAVYCHTTPDGKKYIGMTNMPILTRFGNGRNYFSSIFREAIDRFGWNNIEHEVLEYGLTREQASESEIKYIKLFDTLNREHGYNVATGGIHGYIPNRAISDETKMKIANANRGRKATEEQRRRLSELHKGQIGHNLRPVIKLSKSGEILDEYESLTIAAKENGISHSDSIWKVCNGFRKTCGGFMWKYK